MMKLTRLLIPCLFLVACQGSPPPQTQTWSEFLGQVEQMDAQQLLLARESAVTQYIAQPNDSSRLRAGYVLSRSPASPKQLAQSREILAEIPAGSDLSAMRDLLDGEVLKFMEVQQAESRTLELQAQSDELQARLVVLQEQLDALKSIEEEMVESQQQADEMHP